MRLTAAKKNNRKLPMMTQTHKTHDTFEQSNLFEISWNANCQINWFFHSFALSLSLPTKIYTISWNHTKRRCCLVIKEMKISVSFIIFSIRRFSSYRGEIIFFFSFHSFRWAEIAYDLVHVNIKRNRKSRRRRSVDDNDAISLLISDGKGMTQTMQLSTQT